MSLPSIEDASAPRDVDVPRCPSCAASMTVSLGAQHVARCDGCGALWLDAASCNALTTTGLDPAARSVATRTAAVARRPLRGAFREPATRSAGTRACPVCLRDLGAFYVHDADVTIRHCEHGVLVADEDVAAFLLASDIRRTLAEVDVARAHARHLDASAPRPGGLLLRFGAVAFLVALALPAAHVTVLFSRSNVVGLFGAVFGPLVALEHPMLAVPVVANFFALALLLFSRRLRETGAAVFACVFALAATCAVLFGLGGEIDVLVGYWTWCAALVSFALGMAVRSAPRQPAVA